MSGRKLMLVVALAASACDLQPPPKNKPAPAAPSPPPTQAPAPPPPPAGSGSAAGSAAEVSEACTQVGVHYAEVWIGEAKDAQERAALEQDRSVLVRRASLACTQGGWSDDVKACLIAAKTRAEIQQCQKKIVPAGNGGGGGGSAG
jgi:hypothetical protein